jgi:monoamine oxidase
MKKLDRVFYDTLQKELCVGDFWKELIAGVTSNPLPILPALGFERVSQEPGSVAVIGAGLSGLAAAFELVELGFNVTVFEARGRVGGRTLSKKLEDSDIVFDEGGEFIGANHHLWRYYASLFKINLIDSNANYGFLNIPLIPKVPFNGLTEKRLSEVAAAVSQIMAPDWQSVDLENPWRSPNAKEFDSITLTDVLRRATDDDHILALLKTYLMADRGVNPDQISYLGFLVLVAAHGGDLFWVDTERFRCPDGAQTLAKSFYSRLAKRTSFRFMSEVQSIECSNREVTITGYCRRKNENGRFEEKFDEVVLAVPPPIWEKITVSPPIPPEIHPEFGLNIKVTLIMEPGTVLPIGLSTESVYGDGKIHLCWDGKLQGQSPLLVLNVFTGGTAASELSNLAAKNPSRFESLVRKELNKLSLELGGKVREILLKRWPNSRYTGGSYSYPGIGDVTEGWPRLHDEIHPRLQLAGEPISFKFAYMEGALISGVLAATEIKRKYH